MINRKIFFVNLVPGFYLINGIVTRHIKHSILLLSGARLHIACPFLRYVSSCWCFWCCSVYERTARLLSNNKLYFCLQTVSVLVAGGHWASSMTQGRIAGAHGTIKIVFARWRQCAPSSNAWFRASPQTASFSELSIGPFCVTRPNPTHYKWKILDPTQFN